MAEIPEPRLEINVHFDNAEKFAEAVKHLGRLASQPMTVEAFIGDEQLGLFEVDYRTDSGRETVTEETFNKYYFEIYRPERASNFPGVLFTRIANAVGEEGLIKNDKQKVTAIKRSAFDEFVTKTNRQKVEDIGRKSLTFIRGLQKVLPPVTD